MRQKQKNRRQTIVLQPLPAGEHDGYLHASPAPHCDSPVLLPGYFITYGKRSQCRQRRYTRRRERNSCNYRHAFYQPKVKHLPNHGRCFTSRPSDRRKHVYGGYLRIRPVAIGRTCATGGPIRTGKKPMKQIDYLFKPRCPLLDSNPNMSKGFRMWKTTGLMEAVNKLAGNSIIRGQTEKNTTANAR